MKKIKKIGKLLAIAATVAITFTGCSGKGSGDSNSGDGTTASASASDAEIVIGTNSGSLCLAPLHIALDNGYFEEEFSKAGIKWRSEEIDIQQAADLLASGKINACVGLAGSLIPQIDSGLDITFTGGLHTGCTKYYVKADSDIKSLEDLKGKTIGVPGMSDSSVIALKRKLYDLGIGVNTDNMEIKLVAYNMTDLPLALENGAVDAIGIHDPVATAGEQEYGFRKILDLTEDEKFKDEYCCQIYVTSELAEKNPEAAAAYTRALLKASAFVQANPEEAAKLQLDNNQSSGELETNAKLLGSYNYAPSVSLAQQTVYDASNELIRIGELQEGTDVDEFTKKHFTVLDNVPDSYVYNDDGTFTEVQK
jgi:NitT/TauT family transport system substrate-binding protein